MSASEEDWKAAKDGEIKKRGDHKKVWSYDNNNNDDDDHHQG